MTDAQVLRIVQWTTGNVGQETVRAVLERDDMELVGVFAHSVSKVGRDVAELCGLPEPTRVLATGDIDHLLGLEPDCVVYTPLHLDVDELVSILRAGSNVVTSSEFLTGRMLDTGQLHQIEDAAAAGGSSVFGSGMNPGFVQILAGVAAGASRDLRHVRATESVDVSLFAGDANFDAFGWGRPQGDPGHAADLEQATAVFAEGVDVLARILGFAADDLRCTVEFAVATKDLALPGRPMPTGTVAGIDVRWEALQHGTAVVELHQRWVMSSHIEPAWPVEHGWIIEVTGNPRLRLKLDVWPDTEDLGSLTIADFHSIGMRLTGVPLVNAIPAVCAAEPGLRTYADLSLPSPQIRSVPS